MTRLLADLLDASRISRGKVTLDRQDLDLRELMREIEADYKTQVGQARAALAFVIPDEPIWVSADRTRLNQCVGNLIQNALKFTPPGGHVVVALKRHGAEAEVSVSDDGIGIEPELAQNLFKPFVQGRQGKDRRHGGLGLGLPVVKGLIELHGGRVSIESPGPGKGTTVRFALPLTDSPALLELPQQESGATMALDAKRVLIIEDFVDAAQSLERALTLKGFHVRVSHAGLDGVRAAREFHPHAVVCDIGLPDIDGLEVCRRLLALRLEPKPRMIAVSGYGQKSDVAQSLAAGFLKHFVKPVKIDQLVEALKATDPSPA